MWNDTQNKLRRKIKQKLIEKRLLVKRGKGLEVGRMGEGVNCMVMGGNWTCGSDHFVVYRY